MMGISPFSVFVFLKDDNRELGLLLTFFACLGFASYWTGLNRNKKFKVIYDRWIMQHGTNLTSALLQLTLSEALILNSQDGFFVSQIMR